MSLCLGPNLYVVFSVAKILLFVAPVAKPSTPTQQELRCGIKVGTRSGPFRARLSQVLIRKDDVNDELNDELDDESMAINGD